MVVLPEAKGNATSTHWIIVLIHGGDASEDSEESRAELLQREPAQVHDHRLLVNHFNASSIGRLLKLDLNQVLHFLEGDTEDQGQDLRLCLSLCVSLLSLSLYLYFLSLYLSLSSLSLSLSLSLSGEEGWASRHGASHPCCDCH